MSTNDSPDARTTEAAPLYPGLARKYHDAVSEQGISDFWKQDKTFARSLEQRESAPNFVFYEGPPTANGLPGVHHVIARLCKDTICRFKTMTGHRVVRKAGWDTHGLPVERALEKTLGINGRQEIEEYGLAEFNEKCRSSVWTCKSDWDEFTEKIGYWVDLDDPYVTYDNNYIETVWWILNRFHAAGLLYLGQKVVPYCPVCGTPLSSHEMANGYQTVNDPSIYVKMKAVDADEYFLTWTTTPWTLPSNVALAVGAKYDYVKVRHGEDILILAEARLAVLDEEVDTEVLEHMKGSDLVGRRYEQLLPFMSPGEKNAFVVVPADFVTLDSGSGIVHMAPAFGEDDYRIGQQEDLAFFKPVDAAGCFTEEIEPWTGLHVKKADPKITQHLRDEGKLLREESYSHDYPFHDRCGNPLIYFAMPSWFIKTSAMRDQLVAANEQIRWAPPEVGSGRFGNWLAGNIDWSLSRNRFWGTPLNVWVCDTCGKFHLPTCRDDLTKLTGTDCSELDLHRPFVDDISFRCVEDGCKGTMRRTSEVIDCWFDSGSMPFAQYHYPFENKELFESQFPADFISEGVDQTRGWFYTMLVISTFLFGHSSYKSCLCNELILDKKGKKMSKSKGNVVDPRDILEDEGADPLRWYMITCSPVWVPTRFDREGVREAQRKLLATLENTYNFFALYANIDRYEPGPDQIKSPDLLDRWILSRLGSVAESVTRDIDNLHLTRAAKTLGDFVIDDVSNWYLRLSRRRFWQGDMNDDKLTAFAVLHRVLDGTLRLLAPFIPFTTEEIYRALNQHLDPRASVHMTDYPEPDVSFRDTDLEDTMKVAQNIVGLGRSVRQEAALRTRQPLGRLLVHADDERAARLVADERLVSMVAEELNVKQVDLLDDPLDVAEFQAKANFRALGPRFGKQAPVAAKRISAMTSEEVMVLRRDKRVSLDVAGAEAAFGFEEILVSVSGKSPYIAASEGSITVALDTTLTDELRAEGLSREIVNRIQNLRKKSGLEVADHIRLSVGGPDVVADVMAVHGSRIADETLADEVTAGKDLAFSDACEIDGVEVVINIERVKQS